MVDDITTPGPSKSSPVALGLAAASAQAEEAEADLSRLLRYALMVDEDHRSACSTLCCEIIAAIPELEELAAAWAQDPVERTKLLADGLDTLAVNRDRTLLVALADSTRLLGVTDEERFASEQRCVAATLTYSLRRVERTIEHEMRVRLERVALGWALVASGAESPMGASAFVVARYLADARVSWIKKAARAEAEQWLRATEQDAGPTIDDSEPEAASDEDGPPPVGFVRVWVLGTDDIKQKKLKDVVAGHEHVLGCDVPLAHMPDLTAVRAALTFEFPYALGVIDALLGDLVGQAFVYLRPTILWGTPGSGKTHFCRRLADPRSTGASRFDASTSDGAVIGGTARRWYSAECAHPFNAISRTIVANSLPLIDELEKADTRSDYGRL